MGLIKKYKVMVFSKSYCPFCTKAKTALKNVGLDPEENRDISVMEIDGLPVQDMQLIQDTLSTMSGISSVPQVFIGGEFFSDGTGTAAAYEDGSLQKRLDEVDAELMEKYGAMENEE